jgi:hypothetical protein
MKVGRRSRIVEKNRIRKGVEKSKERRTVEYQPLAIRLSLHSSSS